MASNLVDYNKSFYIALIFFWLKPKLISAVAYASTAKNTENNNKKWWFHRYLALK
jgi:hypothetical protein